MSVWKLVWEDSFAGPEPGPHWVGGLLEPSRKLRVSLGDGLLISMERGGRYASGGLVTVKPVDNDFAAEVAFSVSNPQPGSTLELAAIKGPVPVNTVLKPEHTSEGSAVFNVHGTPPFVSCEFDEDDGWRHSWNRGVGDDPANVYGQNTKRNGYVDRVHGWLWLERRNGHHWLARGRHLETEPWIDLRTRDGKDLEVDFLDGPVHLRLVAKHWRKLDRGDGSTPEAPPNQVSFKHFRLYRPQA